MNQTEILIVDDDAAVRDSLRALLESSNFVVHEFDCAKALLDSPLLAHGACVVADIRMPDMDGLALQEELIRRGSGLPVIIVTGHGDVGLAVRAMKAGAVDFIEKPFDEQLMLDSIGRAIALSKETRNQAAYTQTAENRIGQLTGRERQVLEHLVAGRANKVIAYELDISPRTVEIHRAHLMEKMQSRSLSDLIRLALAAGVGPAPTKQTTG
ncbi:MAG TPA: response regulator FixJ [Micropepsaceae bacterium]|jgi:two-component system response regulator FixJ|nr:response regulator FixJ [Micropepsaceae bacterium]